MAANSDRTNITWSDEHQRLAELVVKKHAGRMGELGIPTRSATRPGGEQGVNRSGAILFALMLAAGETDKPGEV
jgi:hypothetical protein